VGKQKFFESFQLSTKQRRIKGYGAPGRFGGMGGVTGPIEPASHPHHHLPKVARAPYTSPPDMCAWAWNI
jgi:hypothetical protein